MCIPKPDCVRNHRAIRNSHHFAACLTAEVAVTLFVLMSPAIAQNISVKIISPGSSQIVNGPELYIQVSIVSDYQLKSIIATVESKADSNFQVGTYFNATMSLEGLNPSLKTLRVKATDYYGNSASDSVQFDLSPLPTITLLEAPLPGTCIAGNIAALKVKATGVAPPFQIMVWEGNDLENTVMRAQDSLTTDFDVSRYHGQQDISLSFQVTDAKNQTSLVVVPFYVDTTSGLQPILNMPGTIRAFSNAYVVSADGDALQVLDRSSSVLTELHMPFADPILSVTSTVTGFAVVAGGYPSYYRVYEWSNGGLEETTELNWSDYADISVSDSFLVWTSRPAPATITRKNLLTGDTVSFSVPAEAGNNTQCLASNGAYAFWAGYNIYLYDGLLHQLTFNGGGDTLNVYPSTDGQLVVYREGPGFPPRISTSIKLYDGSTLSTLAVSENSSASPGSDYLVKYGSVGFAAYSALGERNIWLRTPDQTIHQITFFGNTHYPAIEDLTSEPAVLILDGARRIIVDKTGSMRVMSSSLGRLTLRLGTWYLTVGRTLLRLDNTNSVSMPNTGGMISDYALAQNYPNPFNPTTTIRFQLPKTSPVKLMVYDILGREIRTLVNEVKQPGSYEVQFTATNLASGVYLYRLQAGSFAQTRKLCLLH